MQKVLAPASSMPVAGVPVIDAAKVQQALAAGGAGGSASVAQRLRAALADSGCCFVVRHGLEREVGE